MYQTESFKQDNKTDNKEDHSYRIRINDTVVRISFCGESSLNTRLASAFNAMMN